MQRIVVPSLVKQILVPCAYHAIFACERAGIIQKRREKAISYSGEIGCWVCDEMNDD